MRGTFALLVCVATGCHEKAVLVHVDGKDTSAAAVELFLVADTCPDCGQGIGTPKSNNNVVPGTVYYTDGDSRVYYAMKDGETTADFWLEPASTDHLTRIIAVGFDGQGTATSLAAGPSDVTLSQHLGEEWKLVLATQGIMQFPQAAPLDVASDDAIFLWRPPMDPTNPTPAAARASCLEITHASTQKSEFVVPPVDADCDGFTADKECKRTIYRYAAPGDPSQVCVAAPPNVPGSCRVGLQSSCVDGIGGEGCQTSTYCVPDAICNLSQCETQPFDTNCIDQLLTNVAPSSVPRLQCTVPTGSGALCDIGATVDASALFPNCQAVGFVQLGQNMLPPMLKSSILVTTGGTLNITLGTVHAPCMFDISFMGTTQTGTSHPTAFVVTGNSGLHATLPFVLEVTEVGGPCGAGDVATCTFAPMPSNDHVWACGK